MSNELKPCPFCGGEAKISKEITGLTEVWCYNCLTNTGLQPPGDHAIEKWNTRPVEDEMYEALVALVGKCRPGWQEVNVSKETIEKALKALKKARGEK